MPVKRFLQTFNIHRVNLVLYGIILILLLVYHQQLLWSIKVLPAYIKANIPASTETGLALRAAAIIDYSKDFSHARPPLEKAIEIDPNHMALYWLGEYYYRTSEYEKALAYFSRYRQIDSTMPSVYLRSCECLLQLKRKEEAAETLQAGVEYFRGFEEYKPRLDSSLPDRFNDRAVERYKQHKKSFYLLQEALIKVKKLEKSPRDKKEDNQSSKTGLQSDFNFISHSSLFFASSQAGSNCRALL